MYNSLSMSGGGNYVGRYELATIPTPVPTSTWHPIPHIDVINMLTDSLRAKNFHIIDEEFGLSSEGQKMFGVLKISSSKTPEWSRCIGIRNSHDKTLSIGLTAGLVVTVCSNLMFGGTTVIKRRHSSGIVLGKLVSEAINSLENEFETIESVSDTLKSFIINDDEARSCIVKAAESNTIPSCDILPIFNEFKEPRYDEFRTSTRWTLLHAFTEISKKYTPARADRCHRGLTQLFGLNGKSPQLWPIVA